MNTKSNAPSRLFVFISLFILLSDGLFVWINYLSSRQAMQTSLEEELGESRAAFALNLDSTEKLLQQTAAFVASDQRVQQLFLRGKRAIEAEGGGKGGAQAEAVRNALFGLVGPGWEAMQRDYQVRQLHFHLGPGSNSFLRVHRPEKFGDKLDAVRYTIVDANAYREPTSGFETGRVYSGVRGVVPVFATDASSGDSVHVGALEAGTAFPPMLDTLHRHTGSNFAVLLTPEHLRANVWPSFLDKLYRKSPLAGDYFIEASNNPAASRNLLNSPAFLAAVNAGGTHLLRINPNPIAVTSFPLRDYKGTRDAGRPPVGKIVIWKDAQASVKAFEETLFTNLLYAVVAFVLLEVVLFFGIKSVTWRLRRQVQLRTSELADANTALEHRNEELADSLDRLTRTYKQLLESEKMASLGRLVTVVAKEIDAPVKQAAAAASRLRYAVDAQGADAQPDPAQWRALLETLTDHAGTIHENLQHASALVTRFENVASARSLEAKQRFRLCTHIEEIIRNQQARLEKTAHSIHFSCPEDVQLDGYPDTLAQILNQLIGNALMHAFSSTGAGNIFIAANAGADERVQITVRDDGRGIREEHRPHVFEPFYTTSQDTSESGLGLNIVYNLVTRVLGGSIALDEAQSGGTMFVIKFPLEKSAPP